MKKIEIPIVVQPGSQPPEEDGATLDYLDMPNEVWTYAMPSLPEPEEIQQSDMALRLLSKLQKTLGGYRVGSAARVIEVKDLDAASLDLLNQVLGSGEVSVLFNGMVEARIQESVLAGVWRVRYLGDDGEVQRDVIEVADIPSLVSGAVFEKAESLVELPASVSAEVANAPALITEINDKLTSMQPNSKPHVINLSLLPMSDADVDCLVEKLGSGPAVILSRGYGNCRITSTGTRNTWWVQYFNSQDTLILNTIEISAVPEVACAAQEDIQDSAQRLAEILEVYQ